MSQEHALNGWDLLDSGDSESAQAKFLEILAADPRDVKAILGLGFSLTQQGCLDEALEAFQAALALEPDNADAHYGAGWVLCRQKRKGEARLHAQRAVVLAPDVAQYHLLAAACAKRFDRKTICTHLGMANRLAPQMLDGRNRLVLEYCQLFGAEPQTVFLLIWLAIATIVSYSLSSNGWSWWFLTTGMPFLVAGGWNIAKGRRHRALVSFAFLVVWALLAFVAHWSGLNQGA
jgi:tetratricopeptide (TPR) repeat protein